MTGTEGVDPAELNAVIIIVSPDANVPDNVTELFVWSNTDVN